MFYSKRGYCTVCCQHPILMRHNPHYSPANYCCRAERNPGYSLVWFGVGFGAVRQKRGVAGAMVSFVCSLFSRSTALVSLKSRQEYRSHAKAWTRYRSLCLAVSFLMFCFALLFFVCVGRADRGGGGAGDLEQEHLLREQNAIHSSLQSATGVLG